MNGRTLLAGGLLIALGGLATPAEARRADVRFLFDAAPGITVPIADGDWRNFNSPSFKLSLRTGGELWFSRHFGIAGEIDTDLQPLLVTRSSADVRFRGLVGLRLLFGFRVGAFFIRQAIGVDLVGNGLRNGVKASEAALAVEPGVGMQFRFIRRGVVGFAVDFPIGFYGTPYFAADVQFLGFIGVRL